MTGAERYRQEGRAGGTDLGEGRRFRPIINGIVDVATSFESVADDLLPAEIMIHQITIGMDPNEEVDFNNPNYLRGFHNASIMILRELEFRTSTINVEEEIGALDGDTVLQLIGENAGLSVETLSEMYGEELPMFKKRLSRLSNVGVVLPSLSTEEGKKHGWVLSVSGVHTLARHEAAAREKELKEKIEKTFPSTK